MESEELKESDLLLTVILPEGQQSVVTVHGSKPVIDLLVTLCAQYHLNPSNHLIELISSNQKQIQFKPNSLIGLLEAEQVVLKSKQNDGNRKMPSMPVATVRLIINYRKSHKAVVRVNPRLPLFELIPAVCEKCELDPKNTVLLRNSQSEESLDLTKTLNDHGIRDLYAKEIKVDPATPAHKDCEESVTHEEINRRLPGLFRGGKKMSDEISSAKMSLVLSSLTPDISKKKRAPQPPIMPGSQSISSRLISTQDATLPKNDSWDKQRTKRRAPPPPGICHSKPDSSEKERPSVETSVNHKYLDCAQEDRFSGTSFCQYTDSPPSSHLMEEILSEFMERLKAQEPVENSSDRYTASTHTSNLHCSVHKSVDSENHQSLPQTQEEPRARRDGLTFTVVPRKKTQSTNQEFIMLETSESGDTAEKIEEYDNLRNPEPISIKNVTHDKTDDLDKKCENVDILATEKAFGMINLNKQTENHLLEEGKEINEQLLLEQKNHEIKLKVKKIFQNSELSEKAVVLKRCSSSSDKAIMICVEKTRDEFKPPSPSIYMKNKDCKTQIVEKSKKAVINRLEKKTVDKETTTNYPLAPRHEVCPSLSYRKYHDEVQVPFKYQSPVSVSKFGLNPSFCNENLISQNLTQYENPSLALPKHVGPAFNPEPLETVRFPFACLVSPFALAVSQRAMSVREMGYPLNPSAGRFGSITLPHLNAVSFTELK